MGDTRRTRSVAIVGGGLAGLAAAAALSEHGFDVELFEARRELGGRAGSFLDPTTEKLVDHCQHIGMGCCTNLADFFHRTGVAEFIRRDTVLYFIGPQGKRYQLQASRWLPAPLHLLPSLLRFGFLTWKERTGICLALLRMARSSAAVSSPALTIGQWLRSEKQTEQAIERFWSAVLVSALGDSIDNTSFAAARKVFVDGFMANRHAYEIDIPTVSLGNLYGEHVSVRLQDQGVSFHREEKVTRLIGDAGKIHGIQLASGTKHEFDFVVVAIPWRRVAEIIPDDIADAIPEIETLDQIVSSPISSVHLWFDRPITSLPHAALVDRLSQWLFNHGEQAAPGEDNQTEVYYQIVISASHELENRPRQEILDEILNDLAALWPASNQAKLLRWQIISQRDAVFSVRPRFDRLRPSQKTAIANLMLAGDWTRTGWPATMEGAVRSGYLAAEAVLQATGQNVRLLAPDLHRGWLAKRLLGRSET